MPPRAANPVKEKVVSVGAAQLIPNSWHILGPVLNENVCALRRYAMLARNVTKRIFNIFARRMTPRASHIGRNPNFESDFTGTGESDHRAVLGGACLDGPYGAPPALPCNRIHLLARMF